MVMLRENVVIGELVTLVDGTEVVVDEIHDDYFYGSDADAVEYAFIETDILGK